MNTTLLSRMIKELALTHDRITLPGLGVFAAEFVPASFSDKGYVINPPYRRLYFRGRQGDDTLLQDMYARINDTDAETAAKMIASTVSDIRKQLDSKRMVELPGLGKLRATKENTLFFVSEDGLDIYPEGFGMKPVSIRSIGEKEVPAQEPQPQPETMPQQQAQPEPQPEPQPQAETLPQQQAQPEPQPEPQPQPEVQPQPHGQGGSGKRKLRVAITIVLAAAAAVAIFIIVARLCPESALIDSLLYDKSDLETVRWMRDSL